MTDVFKWSEDLYIYEMAIVPIIILLVTLLILFVFLIISLKPDLIEQGLITWYREAIGHYL